MSAKAEKRQFLNREQWLDTAMEALVEGGRSKFSLDALLKSMPVSKGSFYWHFNNRDDFLLALIEHWGKTDTESIANALDALPAGLSAEERLWQLMLGVQKLKLSRRELMIRALALEFPSLAASVASVDRTRSEKVSGLFHEMGFRGDDLQMRTHAFVTVTSLDGLVASGLSEAQCERQLRLRHRLFIKP